MNVQSIMIIVFGAYLGLGLLLANRFINKKLPEIFEEELDTEEDVELVRARENLYDELHKLDRVVGRRGVLTILFIGGMLFWLPIWLSSRLKYFFGNVR